MKTETILRLAVECGLDLFPPVQLVDMGDGTMRFHKSKELTIFGGKIIKFAKLIEWEVHQDEK